MEQERRRSDLTHVSHYLQPYLHRPLPPVALDIGQMVFKGFEDAEQRRHSPVYRRPPSFHTPSPMTGQDTLF